MAEAKLNKEYAFRMASVGALMVGICLWSIYDGRVGWPRQNAALERVRPALLATNLTVSAWLESEEGSPSELTRVFQLQGRKVPARLVKKMGELKLPSHLVNDTDAQKNQAKQLGALFGKPVYSEHDLKTQTIQAVVTLSLAFLAFWAIVAKMRLRFIADEVGLHGSGFGTNRFAYDDVARVDWSRWEEKGIVVLTFVSGKRIRLDGWHFSGMSEVVDQIKAHRPDLV